MTGRCLIGAGALAGLLAGTSPAAAEGGEAQFGQILKRAQQVRDVEMTREEVQRLGQAVSERIRARYGVVQDPLVHKYVTLVGTVLAQASSEPDLPWTFIVLDTPGVNALAAPGGYIHITRGALSLMKDEAELAGVLGHEIVHVVEKHTVRAIQKGKMVQIGADETLAGNPAVFNQLVDRATDVVMAGFGRGEELEADREGVAIASKAGYAPAGLSGFLQTLTARNSGSQERQGLFASHPEMKERLEKIAKTIKDEELAATATVQPRFAKHVTYEPVPIAEITTVDGGAAGLAGGGGKPAADSTAEKKEEPKKKRGFGLSRLVSPSKGEEAKSAEVTGSAAARGVDSERQATGGDDPRLVPVQVTAAELAAFRKEGSLN